VILFDIVAGIQLTNCTATARRSPGLSAESSSTASTMPYVLLVAHDEATATDQIHIRFDTLDPAVEPFGAVVWYPQGAPGVGQALVSGPYRAQDLDILPDGHAIFAYNEPSYPAGPPVGETLIPITTNTIGLLMPETLGGDADPQAFFADGTSTVYGPQWAADGRVALFRRADTTATRLHWIKMGAAVLIPLEQEIAQVLGVPTGLVYSTADGIYYLGENDTSPTGPVFSDPILSGGAAFVWATPFGNPPLALDTLGSSTLPIATPSGRR
jgi:hypothetical protein